MYCPYCGESIEAASRYCPFCGEELPRLDTIFTELHQQLEENRRRIHDSLFSGDASLGARPTETDGLIVYDELEPESKAKLGTFERMVNSKQDFHVKNIGYETTDYAPLANLLGCIIEVETSLSVWQLIRSAHGVKMPECYDMDIRKCDDYILRVGKLEFHFYDARATLGTMCLYLRWKKNRLPADSLADMDETRRFLDSAHGIRNDASHGMFIGEERFNGFFHEYRHFHEHLLPDILRLKQRMKSVAKDEYAGSAEGGMVGEEGIILTDTNRLAVKYDCRREAVVDVLESFIGKSEEKNMHWQLLDMAGAVPDDSPWQFYNGHLSDFVSQKQLPRGLDLHLMIVGGRDVIPSAVYILPEDATSKAMEIPSDLAYAFDDDYIGSFIGGSQKGIDIADVRNTVSRLPLQNGTLSHCNVAKDLGGYLDRSLAQAHGIRGMNVVMTTNKEWIANSVGMSKDLPLVTHTDNADITYNNMYVSPRLDIGDAEAMKYFGASCGEADMMLFNLHGSGKPGNSGFYGEDSSLAFSPAQLRDTAARVILTAACYGARYANYTRDDSMLMSALYKSGVLLYFGSQVSVPMFFDREREESRRILFGTYTGSEVLLRLLTLYLYYGWPSGSAYIKAVCDYFNMCRHIENDNFTLKTILMFGMYGNPMLCVQKRKKLVMAALNFADDQDKGKCVRVAYCKTDTKVVFEKDGVARVSLLDRLRRLVDDNFESIRKMIEDNLYNELGLPPRQLESAKSFSRKNADGCAQTGYLLHYHDPDADFSNDTVVETDRNGHVVRVYKTKERD